MNIFTQAHPRFFGLSLLLPILAFSLLGMPNIQKAFAEPLLRENITIERADGERLLFNVEIPQQRHEYEKGLMNRTSMGDNEGMLFIFKKEAKRSFWMKNTLIPLDLLFTSRDGTIHHIHHMAKPQDLTQITSEKPAMAVLEINGGLSNRLGIHEGDKVLHPVFRNMLDQ